MTSAINYFSEFWNCLGIDNELGEVVWMAQLSLCAGINIILYLARKVFLFYFSCSSFSIFFHFSNFQKLSSCLILCGVGWYLKYYYRDGVWSHHWGVQIPPFFSSFFLEPGLPIHLYISRVSEEWSDLFVVFKTAWEIPSLNKEIQEQVHCGLQRKMWGEVVPSVPLLSSWTAQGKPWVQ